MKHVWILNHYAVEPGGAGGTRHYNLAKNFPANGWSASIIASSVELNSGQQRLGPKEKIRLELCAGIPFLWIRTPRYHGNGGGRLLNMLVYSARVLLPSATQQLAKPDVIIGSSVHPFAALAAAWLARRHKVPFIFEVRDLWPQTLIDLGRIKKNSIFAWAMRRLERSLYRRASSIVVLLPRAADYIVKYGISPEKIVWIPNGVELSEFPDPGPPSRRTGNSFTLMYFGAHGLANGLDNILNAMKIVETEMTGRDIRLRMIGDGPRKLALQELAKKLKLNNVIFEPPVQKTRIPALAVEADAFVFNLVNSPVFQYGISSNKLYDFMAAARPVIFCCDASNNPVEEANCGLTVPPDNAEALAKAIIQMSALSEVERVRHGHNARQFVEKNHGFDELARKFSDVLDACIY